MAHLIDMSNNQANMAFVGETPWHGLGQNLQQGASIEEWKKAAGFDWSVDKSPVMFDSGNGMVQVPKRFVLHRSDTHAPLSVMSGNYNITQPGEVLEFFRDLTEVGGMKLETAGMLRGGATYWALARVDDSFDVGQGDNVLPYLLLATSCDGTLSNCAQFTTVRVVCNNTLSLTLGKDGAKAQIRVPHSTAFNPVRFKTELGLIGGSWERFKKDSVELAKREVSPEETIRFFLNVLYPNQSIDPQDVEKRSTMAALITTLNNGVGQSTSTTKGTAWGLLNATTRWADFERKSANQDNRLQSAWFGSGANYKARALDEAMALLAA